MAPRFLPRSGFRFLGLACAFAGAAACAGGAMVHAARAGDRPTLRADIDAALVTGRLSLGQAADVAHEVVEREVLDAPTPAVAAQRVHEVSACAFAVDDVLAARMKVDDEAGSEAAFLRFQAGAIGSGVLSARLQRDDRVRAVVVWGMTGAGEHEARVKALSDGSPSVRRAALHAVVRRDDASELGALVETARLDPDPLVRAAAIRALGRFGGSTEGRVSSLRDLWTSGDDGSRGDIASALATPLLLKAGGAGALAHLLLISRDNDAVTVAGAVLDANADDAALRAQATAVLASALRDGGARARLHAIAVVPLGRGWGGRPLRESDVFASALREASRLEDIDVRLAALGRLAASREGVTSVDREDAVRALEALAAPDDAPSLRASRARLLLAEAGDLRVQRWVEADLRAPEADARIGAAEALSALGRASRAAPLLADDDPGVRTRAACVILLAARLR